MTAPFERIEGQPRDLGGFTVRRVLPSAARRSVGPFVFFDHLGPATLDAGGGIVVRPHPHIGLATVTYLFDGEIVHRDSLGTVQSIRPGDVNWMTSGRGIVHSERSPDASRTSRTSIHAIQSWVALPVAHEDDASAFAHHPAASLPAIRQDGVTAVVVAGDAYGLRSPVAVLSPTLYVVAHLDAGAALDVTDEHAERAVYVVDGDATLAGEPLAPRTMGVLPAGGRPRLVARTAATVLLVGGAALDGPRALDWNFVASRRDAIARARADWTGYPNARFPQVPGEDDHIPLPPPVRAEPTIM